MPIEWSEGSVVAERFRLTRLLGRGGMGSVWQATHLGLDVPCAIKFIDGEVPAIAEAHQRFENEAKAAAQLRSPHVVQIFDHGVWEGKPYIVMEFLDGEDLGKRLARLGRLPPREVSAIVSQVARALGRAHAVGIIHRDLKPENVFLVKDDEREIVKVVDFGIAKGTGPRFEGSRTRTGALMGTPYYMSPEQAQGAKTIDGRSDLWSLAVIAFQALTGQLPFEGEALGDLFVKIIVSPVPVPSSFAEVPAGFDAFWAKAASRDPGERYPTARDFAEAFSLVCEGVSRPPAGTYPGELSASTPRFEPGAPSASSPAYAAVGAPPRSTPPGAVDALAISSAAPLARSEAADPGLPPSGRARRRTTLVVVLFAALSATLGVVAFSSRTKLMDAAPSVARPLQAPASLAASRPTAESVPEPVLGAAPIESAHEPPAVDDAAAPSSASTPAAPSGAPSDGTAAPPRSDPSASSVAAHPAPHRPRPTRPSPPAAGERAPGNPPPTKPAKEKDLGF